MTNGKDRNSEWIGTGSKKKNNTSDTVQSRERWLPSGDGSCFYACSITSNLPNRAYCNTLMS